MPQIIDITSEAIQATIRRLLPSQRGFGMDMQASNVITPIIDVTRSAEGTQLPAELQYANSIANDVFFATGSQDVTQGATGFYRVIGTSSQKVASGSSSINNFDISDGTTTTVFWGSYANSGVAGEIVIVPYDFVVYLRAGQTLNANANASGGGGALYGSARQIADVYGNLTNPAGFTFE